MLVSYYPEMQQAKPADSQIEATLGHYGGKALLPADSVGNEGTRDHSARDPEGRSPDSGFEVCRLEEIQSDRKGIRFTLSNVCGVDGNSSLISLRQQ